MAEAHEMINWKHEYDRLKTQCSALERGSGRQLGMFALGALVAGGVGAGLHYWKKRKGCGCEIKPLKGKPAAPGSNGKNGKPANDVGNSKDGNGAPVDPGGMAPGDS